MLSLSRCLISIAILICFSTAGYAIKCYKCSTTVSFECSNTPPNSRFLYDCDNDAPPYWASDSYRYTKATGCMIKLKEDEYNYGYNDADIFQRDCYWGDISNAEMNNETSCADDPFLSYKTKSCEVCGTDNCNTGTLSADTYRVTNSATTAAIPMAIVIISAIIHWMA